MIDETGKLQKLKWYQQLYDLIRYAPMAIAEWQKNRNK